MDGGSADIPGLGTSEHAGELESASDEQPIESQAAGDAGGIPGLDGAENADGGQADPALESSGEGGAIPGLGASDNAGAGQEDVAPAAPVDADGAPAASSASGPPAPIREAVATGFWTGSRAVAHREGRMTSADVGPAYRAELEKLVGNLKPVISNLSRLADDYKTTHAEEIINSVAWKIRKAPGEAKLPFVYLLDSLVMNVGEPYRSGFAPHVPSVLSNAYEAAGAEVRAKLRKLLELRRKIYPEATFREARQRLARIDGGTGAGAAATAAAASPGSPAEASRPAARAWRAGGGGGVVPPGPPMDLSRLPPAALARVFAAMDFHDAARLRRCSRAFAAAAHAALSAPEPAPRPRELALPLADRPPSYVPASAEDFLARDGLAAAFAGVARLVQTRCPARPSRDLVTEEHSGPAARGRPPAPQAPTAVQPPTDKDLLGVFPAFSASLDPLLLSTVHDSTSHAPLRLAITSAVVDAVLKDARRLASLRRFFLEGRCDAALAQARRRRPPAPAPLARRASEPLYPPPPHLQLGGNANQVLARLFRSPFWTGDTVVGFAFALARSRPGIEVAALVAAIQTVFNRALARSERPPAGPAAQPSSRSRSGGAEAAQLLAAIAGESRALLAAPAPRPMQLCYQLYSTFCGPQGLREVLPLLPERDLLEFLSEAPSTFPTQLAQSDAGGYGSFASGGGYGHEEDVEYVAGEGEEAGGADAIDEGGGDDAPEYE
eukprot:tig00001628_g9432.t1